MAAEDYADLDAMSHAVLNGAPEAAVPTETAAAETAAVQAPKTKKPMTEKQKASLEKARIARQANAEKRKALKEKALVLAKQMEDGAGQRQAGPGPKTKRVRRPAAPPPVEQVRHARRRCYDDYSDTDSAGSFESYSSYSDDYSDDEPPRPAPRGRGRARAPAAAPASRMKQYQVKPRREYREYEEPVVRAPKLTAMEKKIEAQNARIEFIQQQIAKPPAAMAPAKATKPSPAVVKAVERLNSLNIQFDD